MSDSEIMELDAKEVADVVVQFGIFLAMIDVVGTEKNDGVLIHFDYEYLDYLNGVLDKFEPWVSDAMRSGLERWYENE